MQEPSLYKKIRGPLNFLFRFLFRPTIINAESIPKEGRLVLAGNHTSCLDCLLVACSTKRVVHFLAKEELVTGMLGFAFKRVGIIPVNRKAKDKNALHSAEKVLEQDGLIGIFPEGRTNLTGVAPLLKFKYGAVKMAKDTDSTIIPFAITGRYRLFMKRIKITFLPPMKVGDDLTEANDALRSTVLEVLTREGHTSKTPLFHKAHPVDLPPVNEQKTNEDNNQ